LKTGEWERRDGHLVRVWKCSNPHCPHKQAEEAPFTAPITHRPAVLYFDIETAPHSVLTFDLKVPSKYISVSNLVKERFILCWAAGWLDEWMPGSEYQKLYSSCITGGHALEADDKTILKDLFDMIDRADYVVGHNSDNFDIKMANWRFKVHDIGMPYLYKQIDTLKLSRKYYKPPSHGLDFLAPCMGGEKKMHMEWDDWKEIVTHGDSERLRKMEEYCRGDVRNGITAFQSMTKDIEASGRKVFK
jgi:DNA polymerase elongation subunit (family B)